MVFVGSSSVVYILKLRGLLGRSRWSWKDNIKIDLKEIGF